LQDLDLGALSSSRFTSFEAEEAVIANSNNSTDREKHNPKREEEEEDAIVVRCYSLLISHGNNKHRDLTNYCGVVVTSILLPHSTVQLSKTTVSKKKKKIIK